MFRQGSGRLCLDFVRTLRYRGTEREVEELADGPALRAWAVQCGPDGCTWPDHMAGTGPEQARELREAIHRLLVAALGEAVAPLGPDTRGRVNAAAVRPPPVPRMDTDDTVRWVADGAPALLSLVSRDAIDLLASAEIRRVRRCANPDCGALFLDRSRPGHRRWCSMNRCGNLAKKATLRERRS